MIEHWLLGWWNWLATEVIGFIYLLVINIALTGSAMFPEVCEKFGVRRGKGGGVNTWEKEEEEKEEEEKEWKENGEEKDDEDEEGKGEKEEKE